MENKIVISTKDKHKIYGTLNSSKRNTTLLIFVHGLSGNQYEHQYFNAVPFFTKKGFDTYRFDFYQRAPKARQLSKSSVATHVKDLEAIIKHFKNKYNKIILIGHSLGGYVILKTNLSDIFRIVLWDPAAGYNKQQDKYITFSPSLKKYILSWGIDIIIGKQMIKEWKEANNPKSLIEKIQIPCKFIFAEFGTYKHWKPFSNMIKVKNEFVIIKGADHCFCKEGTEQKLFMETLKWIKNK